MELREIDLNLLVIFNQLLVEKRVSAVAETLGLSQPAVSNALNRLRRLLGDELFLRTSRGMEPTPFATQLAEPVAYALGTLHGALNQQIAFAPESSSRHFTLAMTDIGEIYFLPRLADALARQAPGITLGTVRTDAIQLREEMEAGHIDLAVGLLPRLQAGFFQRRLFRHRYVCMYRQGHPLEGQLNTVEAFSAAEHVVVLSAGTGHSQVDALLERSGVRRQVRLKVPHFVAVGHILQGSDLVATVPERFAERCAGPFGLRYCPHPVALPEIAINLFWHAKFHRDPGNRWLRRLIGDLFADPTTAPWAAGEDGVAADENQDSEIAPLSSAN